MILNRNVVNRKTVRAEARFFGDEIFTNIFGSWRKITDPSILERLNKARNDGVKTARDSKEWEYLANYADVPDLVSEPVGDDFTI